MEKPHVTFHINKKLEKKMINYFLKNDEKGGFNFAKTILEDHPDLLKIKDDHTKVDQYVDNYYNENQKILIKSKQKFQDKWSEKEDTFLQLTNSLFKTNSWPEGNYKGYVSIVQCGPRFLETCEFQTYFGWDNNFISQVAHEMLHFKFFDTVKRLGLNPKDEKIWLLSEITNDIIQSESDFVKLQGYKPSISYPEYKNTFNIYKKIYKNSQSIEDFILNSIKN